MDLMTFTQYAAHRGCSQPAISKLVKAGRIPTTLCPRTGKKRIDPAVADHALGETKLRLDEPRPLNVAKGALRPATDEAAAAGAESNSAALTKARTVTEEYRAKSAELDYQQRVGRLVAIEDVEASMAKCAEVMVREIDQLPVLADDLATAVSRNGVSGVRKLLKDKARSLRESVASSMRLMATAESDGADDEEEKA
ncbi:hypothetical protein [Afifella sp. IM 167]|uniref:hypothetical protein n=1 Tax=Afifella sp. IM 167 TaxID=2033586 RepID=UPI001CCBD3ED|nr:hypothetical protein [Afifella sp. IM 167]